MVFFCLFQPLCSFVVPLSHFAYFALFLSAALQRNMKVCKVLREVLFSIYYLYFLLPPSSPFTSACQSLSSSCHCCFHFSVFLSVLLTCIVFLSTSFFFLTRPAPLSTPLLSYKSRVLFLAIHSPEFIGC